jgi:hypothetical protein
MLTVTVNDRPLDVAAIVERGRVLLPMRATFSALGASIRYDRHGRVIVARSTTHALKLRVGANTATVDGRRVALDVPARIVAARTFVPLRFVAQSMGAIVGYDAAAKLVNVSGAATLAVPATRRVGITAINPAPQSVVDTAYPTISASLGFISAARGGVTLMVDGEDVTSLASFDGSTITYMPRVGLRVGTHTISFSGRTNGNAAFSTSWSFETSRAAAPDAPAFSNYNFQFYTNGSTMFYPGDWMHFYLIAPPGGSAELQLCGLGYQYGLWSTRFGTLYEANFPAPTGYWLPSCTVTAVYTAWNGKQFFVPIPVVVGLYTSTRPAAPTPTPSPHPTSSPRSLPGAPRRVQPTPSPKPTPRPPLPHPTPHPIPTHAPPRPIPTHAPPRLLPAHAPPRVLHPVPKSTRKPLEQ